MNEQRADYVAYMLRLWLENDRQFEGAGHKPGEWRASLEDPHTQQMQVFTDLESLFNFLRKETKRRLAGDDGHLATDRTCS